MARIVVSLMVLQQLPWFYQSLARPESVAIYKIRGGSNDFMIELNPNYKTRRLTTSRRNLILEDASDINHFQSTYYEGHNNFVQQKPKKKLIELLLEYAHELHRKSPVLYYGTTSSIILWLLWQVNPLIPILQRHFVCSWTNLRNGRIHTIFSSSISHTSLGHLLINTYAYILFGTSVQKALIESQSRRKGIFAQSLWPLCLGAAIFGNISYFICNHILNIPSGGCIGGSSVTCALLAVDAKFYPSKPLGFLIHFFPVRIPAQYALTVLLALSMLGTLGASIGFSENVSHASHLGGLLFGILYYEIFSNERLQLRFYKTHPKRWSK
jgi:membrane associated rhomboid family serine protease